MIISHKYKFIFIKTTKTAGTSIEVFLSPLCGERDIVTPVNPHVEPHAPRNHQGIWNPIPEMLVNRGLRRLSVLRRLMKRRKFYNHIPAKAVRAMIPEKTWNEYFKFCVERNPWDKTLSHFHMLNNRSGRNRSFDEYLRKGRLPVNYPIYTDNRGHLLVDKVIRYESLPDALGGIFGRLGIPFNGTLGVQAKSEHRKDRRPYQEVYTPEQRAIVAEAFRGEIEMHGYVF